MLSCNYFFHVVSSVGRLNMFGVLVMTCVHTSDDMCNIFCNHVVLLNFLNYHIIPVNTCLWGNSLWIIFVDL